MILTRLHIVAVVLEKRKEHPDLVASAASRRKVGSDGFTVPGHIRVEQVPNICFSSLYFYLIVLKMYTKSVNIGFHLITFYIIVDIAFPICE